MKILDHPQRSPEWFAARKGLITASKVGMFCADPFAISLTIPEIKEMLAIGDAKSLVQRRADALARFAKLGVAKEKVCEALGVRSPDDIQLEHLEIIFGYYTAIKDGDATIDQIFNPTAEAGPKKNPFQSQSTEPATQESQP